MPAMVPPAPATGTLRYYWVDPRGTLRDLNKAASPNIWVSAGSVGLGSAHFNAEEDKRPIDPGTTMKRLTTDARKLVVPITVVYDTLSALALAVEDIHEWFDTGDENNLTPGIFRVIRPDDSIRQIKGYHLGGLEGDLTRGGPDWTTFALELHCPDPWPTDIDDVTYTFVPIDIEFPFALLNPGKLLAYPRWTFAGPFNDLDLINISTGKTFYIRGSVLAGQSITVDTRPSDQRDNPSAYDQDGNTVLNLVIPTSNFWQLQPGSNTMQVIFSGGGVTADTSVSLAFLPRYRSLLR